MLDRLRDYQDCFAEPDRWAIATVAAVSGSVPRPIGTSMAVRDDATTIGSISAGCVESAIVDAALTNLITGRTTLENFGDGEDSLAVGLMCGGDLQVLVQPVRDLPAPPTGLRQALVRSLTGERLGASVVIDLDTVTAAELDRALGLGAGALLPQLRAGGTQHLELRRNDANESCAVVQRLLVESSRSQPLLLIYGANDYAAALARAAVPLDHRVVVCDARPVFATTARHPEADEVIVDHPVDHLRRLVEAGQVDDRTAVVVLTHDPRYDLPVLDLALRSEAGYVGALGSRQTAERRAQELRHGGLPAQLLKRLHAPIGLDLGATTPAEVAISILAELIRCGSGRADAHDRVLPLYRTSGPVHVTHRRSAPAEAALL